MERIIVTEAARLLGVSAWFVRIGMQRGKLPIGQAVKLSEDFTGIKKPPAATGGSART